MRVAIVHDWLTQPGGAEKVLDQIIKTFPDADLYTLVDHLGQEHKDFLRGINIRTSFLQRMPFSKTKYRSYLALMPIAIEQFDFSDYDLVISSSYAVAKGIITGPNQVHVSYIHSPIRYAWDMQSQYLKESGLLRGVKSAFARAILHYVRLWDVRSSAGPDLMIANSRYIARRIKKCYGRDALVLYPPINTKDFVFNDKKEDFYLTASRMVPYKKIPLIVSAFKDMPDKKLVVIGSGPDFERVKLEAGSNVNILGYQDDSVMRDYFSRAKAFIFAAEEDFGIVPVEAQASGTPVIAYGRGGALETVNDGSMDGMPSGVFFEKQDTKSIVDAVIKFEKLKIDSKSCLNNVEKFQDDFFRSELKRICLEAIEKKNNFMKFGC